MEGNPTNKDTNIEDHLNGGSISMGTTTIAQKAPQLVLTDLVHQLEPPIDGPEYPLPVPDNTLLTLTEWVYSLDLPSPRPQSRLGDCAPGFMGHRQGMLGFPWHPGQRCAVEQAGSV